MFVLRVCLKIFLVANQ